jgi:hypothetical protein
MTFQGIVREGSIKLPPGVELPEGTEVRIDVVPPKPVPADDADTRPIGKKLVELARRAKELPSELPADFSINHDHYLYGTPKK